MPDARAEFIAARIAEDEVAAAESVGFVWQEDGPVVPLGGHARARLECEAKRAILASILDGGDPRLLTVLARIWEDHPDFDLWRTSVDIGELVPRCHVCGAYSSPTARKPCNYCRTFEGGSEAVLELLVGQRVIDATEDTLTLSDGTKLRFERTADDCCSWLKLQALATTDNIITAARYGDNEDEAFGEGEGEYRAWIHVITEAGELNIAEAEGDLGSGYYLHGFALHVTVNP